MSEAEQSANTVPDGGSGVSPKKKRVLLAQDDLRARYTLLDQFNKQGLEVELAANGAIALKKAAAGQFDAIILDILLHGMKGIDLIKQIRAKKGFENIPVFVCASPARMDAWRRKGAKIGATKVFDKSSSSAEVIVSEVVAVLSQKPEPTPQTTTSTVPVAEEAPMIVFEENPALAVAPVVASDKCPSERLRNAVAMATPSRSVPAEPEAPRNLRAEAHPPPIPRGGFTEIVPRSPPASQGETRLEELELANVRLTKALAQVTSDRDALVTLLRDRPIIGDGPVQDNGQLEKAKAVADQAKAAYEAEAARSRQFQEESDRLREARDELNKKLEAAARAEVESGQRAQEMESRLRDSASELQRVKGELDKHIAERNGLEKALGDQLSAAKAAAEKAQAAYKTEFETSRRAAAELAALRQAREELNSKLVKEQQEATESKRRSEEREQRLKESAAELERLTAELKKQGAERGSLESTLSRQLEAARKTAEKAQQSYQEEAQRGQKVEQELARLARAREELNEKLLEQERLAASSKGRGEELERSLAASSAELQRVKTELQQQATERSRVEAQLREQLTAAKASAEKAQTQHRNETALFTRSTEEINALREARDQLNARLAGEQQAAAESKRRSEQLEARLRESGTEIARMKAELEKLVAERSSHQRLKKQIEEVKAAAEKSEKAYKKEADRRKAFEKELDNLRQLQSPNAKSKRRIQQLEECLRLSTGEMASVKVEWDKQVADRKRLETDYREVQASKEAGGHEPARAQERAPSQQGDTDHMDLRIRENISAVARATADLEKERGERRRLEQRVAFLSGQLQNLHEELRKNLEVDKSSHERIAELQEEVREREQAIAQANRDLQKAITDRQLAEAQLRATGEMSSQLKEQFGLLDEAKAVFKRTQEDLESRLKAGAKALEEAQAKLQKQNSERQRMQTALEDAQRKVREQEQQSGIEISKLQSALQVESLERRRVETQAVQSRYASLDAARVGRAFVSSFRNQLRPPADSLMQSIRRLLELSLEQEHKKLVESVLENALLLQTNLQEEPTYQSESAQPQPEVQGQTK